MEQRPSGRHQPSRNYSPPRRNYRSSRSSRSSSEDDYPRRGGRNSRSERRSPPRTSGGDYPLHRGDKDSRERKYSPRRRSPQYSPPRGNSMPHRSRNSPPRGNSRPTPKDNYPRDYSPHRGRNSPPRGNSPPYRNRNSPPRGNSPPYRNRNSPPRGNSPPYRNRNSPPRGSSRPTPKDNYSHHDPRRHSTKSNSSDESYSYSYSSSEESPSPKRAPAHTEQTAVDMFRQAILDANGGVEPEDAIRRRNKKAAREARKNKKAAAPAYDKRAPSSTMRPTNSDYHFKEEEEHIKAPRQYNKYLDVEKESADLTEELFVSVEGKNVAKPIQRFTDLQQLPSVIIENLKLAKWDVPTPIQKYALPIGFSGRDIMGCAQTGSGKTAAFLFPIITKLLQRGPPVRTGVATPSALIVVPTRELAQQISIESVKFTYRSPLKSVVVYGGQNTKRDQSIALRNGCDILIGTPGRLIDFLSTAITLKNIVFLCLDEADRMLDMGFKDQLTQIVRACPPQQQRQTLMFSATFPAQIQYLAKQYLAQDYVFITVGRVGAVVAEIKQQLFFVEEYKKFDELIVLLQTHPTKTLIFVKTKVTADTLSARLQRMGVPCDSIHGDKIQQQREYALDRFKHGTLKVLVATDVASRGLDISLVGHVINYDLPPTIDDYTHRIGRTGRIGQPGLASSFYNDTNSNIKGDLRQKLQEAKQEIPSWLSSFGRGR